MIVMKRSAQAWFKTKWFLDVFFALLVRIMCMYNERVSKQ